MTTAACPTDAELAAFHYGDLPAAAQDRVAEHLEHCTACDAKLREFDQQTDPILRGLRDPTVADPNSTAFLRQAPTQAHWEASPPLQPGALPEVPGYDLLEQIGQGGMGVVHKARHRKLKRLVALKRLRASTDWDRERFRTEAEAVAHLQHPNIVQIHEVGELGGLPYMVLEYVEGGTLAQLIAGRPQPARPSAELVRTLARAMQYAHERGIVHRDLKPANILLKTGSKKAKDTVKDPYNSLSLMAFLMETTPKIADFGVAKCLDSGSGQTIEGDMLGTPSYMAPEQARGRPQNIGPPADIYALGAILYELTTGRPPFDSEQPLETVRQVLDTDPVPPSRLQPRLPRDLETIALKCLQKDPAKRYPTAGALSDDLDRFLDGRPITARPTRVWERLGRWARRRPREALLSAAVAASLLAALGLLGWQWHQALAAQHIADTKARDAQVAHRKAERREARMSFDRGSQLSEQGEIGRGLLWLTRSLELATKAGAEDLDVPLRVGIADWARQLTAPALEVLHPDGIRAAAYSPDGGRVATAGADGFVRVWDARSGAPIGLPFAAAAAADGRDAVSALAFTPDGRGLLIGSSVAGLYEAGPGSQTPATGRLRFKLEHASPGSAVTDVAVSADGHRLLTAHDDGRARLWDAADGKLVREFAHGEQPLSGVAFAPPDGRLLLTANPAGGVRVWETATSKDDGWLVPDWVPVHRLAVSPDGSTALIGSDHAARLWDVRGRRPLGQALPHAARVAAAVFSPDGQLCATGDDAGHVRLWCVATRQPVGPLIRHGDAVRALRFSPDGRRLAIGGPDGRLRLWDVPALPTLGPPRVFPKPLHTVAFSGDGAWLLMCSEAEAQLVSPDRLAQPFRSYKLDGQTLTAVALRPDGQRLALGGQGGELRVWDRDSGPVGKVQSLPGAVEVIRFTPDGTGLLTLTGNASGSALALRRWNVSAATVQERPWDEPVLRPRCLAFAPSGRLLAIGCDDGKVRFYDWPSGRADGRDVDVSEPVTALAFSTDGRTLAAGGRDGGLHVLDADDRRPMGPRFGGRDQIEALAFSPDGRTLAAGGRDGAARLWDVRSGLPLGGPLRHGGAVRSVAYHPDGKSLWTAGHDQVLIRWRLPAGPASSTPEQLRLTAELLAGAALDDDGTPRSLDADQRRERRERLDQLGGPPKL